MGDHKRFFGVWDDESELFSGYKLAQYDLPAWAGSLAVMAHDFAGSDGAAEIIASIREVLYARYSGYYEYGTDRNMWARVIFVGVDGQLYEVQTGHGPWQDNGLEDRWRPEGVSAQDILDILADLKIGSGDWYTYDDTERYAIAIGLATYIAKQAQAQQAALPAALSGITPIYNTPCPYVRLSETPEASRQRLQGWLRGQTMPVIDGLDPQDAIYLWDYQRFLLGDDIID